jgi:hypothetical protein
MENLLVLNPPNLKLNEGNDTRRALFGSLFLVE